MTTMSFFSKLFGNDDKDSEQGSGNVICDERTFKRRFTGVTFRNGGDLTLTQGDTELLIIHAEDNVMPQIKSYVKNGTLFIEQDPSSEDEDGYVEPTVRIQFDLTVKDINSFTVSGDGKVDSPNDLNTNQIKLETSGDASIVVASLTATNSVDLGTSGDSSIVVTSLTATENDVSLKTSSGSKIEIGELSAETLNAELSGDSRVDLVGEVTEQTIDNSGDSKYCASELESQNVSVQASGDAHLVVWATETLFIKKASGDSVICHVGNPEITFEDEDDSEHVKPVDECEQKC